ncbi:hypothetical protein [Olivibacter sp. XZL3]|uniref:hypothetical protein n=1 Tax=Olivibacter sp. XZL3 TaxID=1735116 RepID=UPI0010662BF2|nr:hypothetical protein [Olivibacter sp. XZL3]
MKTRYTPIPNTLIRILVIGLISLGSCKKEYEDYPYHDIESFTISDAEGYSLEAAVVGDSIWVYWPPFQTVPDSISPVIGISRNATISPASGEKIAFREGSAYTVVSESGLSKIYYLKPAVNEPPVLVTAAPNSILIGYDMSIRGQYFSTDTNRIHLNLIDEDKNVVPIKLAPENLSSVYINVPIPIDGSVLPEKSYSVQLISGTQSLIYGPFQPVMTGSGLSHIGYQLDQAGTNIKRGSIISFSYEPSYIDVHYFNYEGDLTLYILDEQTNAQVAYNAELLSVTDTKLTYRIGSDAPIGKITTAIAYGQQLSTGTLAVRLAEVYAAPYTTSIVE